MATRSVRPKDDTMLSDWESMPERAPSAIRADKPSIARSLALAGFFLIAVGAIAMAVPLLNEGRTAEQRWTYIIGPTWGLVFATTGLALILFHSFADWEVQFRRLYGFFAIVLLLGSAVLRVLPTKTGMGAWFLPYGVPLMALGYLLTLAVLRHETDEFWRGLLLRLLGGFGAIMIVAAVAVGLFRPAFLPGEGVVLLILGTFFVGGFIGMQEPGSDIGYYAGLALGIFAAAVFVFAAFRSLTLRDYFVPSGLTLLAMSGVQFALALGVCSDHPFIVLTRRELAGFFYSPIAYLVLFGSTIIAGVLFALFVTVLVESSREETIFEPIFGSYLGWVLPVIIQMVVVPALTMRLLSEEKRSGTLEMLLTAPVNETSLVLAKFTAVLIFYLTTWLPYFLFLVALRVIGNEEFDYRPLISFAFTLAAAGGGFLAIGLFFSSITRNQVIAAVLTFIAILVMLCFTIFKNMTGPGSAWREIFNYADFYGLWQNSLRGNFTPSNLVFHISLIVFFLFLSVKVLEARKWK
jgi:ABC-2 type transport system permease protein